MFQNRQFWSRFFLTFVTLILISLFLFLAHWQFNRGEEKNRLQKVFMTRIHYKPVQINDIKNGKDYQFYRIILTGYFDNAHQILIDNKIYNHQVGYQVITPFITIDNPRMILINRGWIPLGKSRQQLPEIKEVKGLQTVKGVISIPSKNLAWIGSNYHGWPLRVQNIETKQIANQLNHTVYNWIVLQNPDDPNGFIRDWQPINFNSAIHKVYAIQWLLFAIILGLIYLRFNFKLFFSKKNGKYPG